MNFVDEGFQDFWQYTCSSSGKGPFNSFFKPSRFWKENNQSSKKSIWQGKNLFSFRKWPFYTSVKAIQRFRIEALQACRRIPSSANESNIFKFFQGLIYFLLRVFLAFIKKLKRKAFETKNFQSPWPTKRSLPTLKLFWVPKFFNRFCQANDKSLLFNASSRNSGTSQIKLSTLFRKNKPPREAYLSSSVAFKASSTSFFKPS